MAIKEVETELTSDAELFDQPLGPGIDMIRNFRQVIIIEGKRVIAILRVISETRSC